MSNVDFRIMVWFLPAALALHEAEEWNILGWYQQNFVGLPRERTNTTIRFFLVFLSLTGFVWTGIALMWGSSAITILILFPLLALIIQNGLQHIYWQFLFRRYAPGIMTSVLFLIPLGFYFVYISIVNDYAPLWYMAVLAVLIIPGLIQTVKARNRLTPAISSVHKFSLFVVKKLGVPNT
jgi:hypothetical protein